MLGCDLNMVTSDMSDLPVVYEIRKALEASVEKKFKIDIGGGGTMLDGSCADFGFVLNNKTYSVIIREEEANK